jgi:hypothetical protein
MAQNFSGRFDSNTYPYGLRRYAKWFPMILAIPGKLWDNAIEQIHLGDNNSIEIKSGVHILNVDNPDDFTHNHKYNIHDINNF